MRALFRSDINIEQEMVKLLQRQHPSREELTMKTTITVGSILTTIAGISAIQVGYVPATSYIYRSDNGGPGNLIQLGAPAYQQPHAIVSSHPISEPVQALEAYDLAPVPLPYIAAKPIAIEDAEDDEVSEESDEYLHGDEGYEAGGGSDYGEEHHAAHGEKGSKGYNSQVHHAKGEAGSYGKEHNEGYYNEAEGEKGAHHDGAEAHGEHHEGGENYEGGEKGHKSHSSKGEDVTGYHKVYHKDEYKKDHDFYDVADNSGHFKKHGHEEKEHGSEEVAHKEGGHSDAGYDKGDYGKSSFHVKGHVDEADAGHSAEEGSDSHYNHHEDYGKKGGSSHEKEYEYDDDEDDEEH